MPLNQVSLQSGQDFTLADVKRLVKFAAGVVTTQAVGSAITTIGVLITPASTGDSCQVQEAGEATAKAGALGITHNTVLASDATGRVIPATTGLAKIGRATVRAIRGAMPTVAVNDDVIIRLFDDKTELAP